MGSCARRCLWVRPGGNIHHLCPHPVGQNQAMAPPRCKEGLGNIIVPGLAAPPQQSFWPGRGAGIFDEHQPSLPQVIGGPAGHRVFLLFMPPCSKSACNLSFIPLSWKLGEQVAGADVYKD